MRAFVCGAAAVFILTATAAAQDVKVSPTPMQGATTSAAPADTKSIVGKWSVTALLQGDAHVSTVDLKLDGKKITGTMNGELGEIPVTGEFADGAVKFSISYQGQFDIVFQGKFKDDGTLEGTATLGQNTDMTMTWKAERAKAK